MFAPLMKSSLLIATIFMLGACAKSGGNDSGGGSKQQEPADDGKLKLKSTAVKKVRVGSTVDLHDYLKNSTRASFEIARGADRVQWADAAAAKLNFKYGGEVLILVVDVDTGVSVALKMLGSFDTTDIVEDPAFPGTPLPPGTGVPIL